ncbi:MAG: flap endonuclease [Dehalococcoidia bacterium]|nr:flap endonuclease [Dehalococcoidia bacterium]HCV00455.1 flap endonuclease [Dehalococcoidia bacterium]
MRLVLLDATYELFRAYFGAPPRTSPDGREIGAVAGIAASTLALLREQEPLAIAAVTDTVVHSFRNELYEGYKTDTGVPPDLLEQFALAEDILEALGVTVWRMHEFEADDGIASGVARFIDDAEQIILASPDKDLAQCVEGEHVVMLDRRRNIITDAKGVREKFGIQPESIPDYLALVGDAADGFPGLPGWGKKSAATLLAHYLHLEEIPKSHDAWEVPVRGASRLAKVLHEGQTEAALFKLLATLRRDAPIEQSFADLEWLGVPRAPWLALCQELGLNDLRSRPHQWLD